MKMRIVAAVLLLACTIPCAASEVAESPMEALDNLVGEWQGEGWIRMGPGDPHRFRSHERVERRLGGRILTIEGRHTDPESGATTFHAFAVISADGDEYRFNSYLSDGRNGQFRGWIEDGDFHWEMQLPENRRIVYRLHIDGDRWEESGRMTLDGENWFETFAMNLTRVRQ